ncbi:MAG: MjaI family restriction endonuclease [Candidatus Paceibacterales bacterium]
MANKNEKNIIKISNKEIAEELIGDKKNFPKYVAPLLNLANRYSKGTTPRVVGQLTELMKECPEKTYEGWVEWYKRKHPRAIDNAKEKISEMIKKFKEALDSIDDEIIIKWVEDLTLDKTYTGLRFQEVIIKKVAELVKGDYRPATPGEEARGIDGIIGEAPVSVKPVTYKLKKELTEKIDAKIIYYEKKNSDLIIDISEF